MDMLNLYKCLSENISQAVALSGKGLRCMHSFLCGSCVLEYRVMFLASVVVRAYVPMLVRTLHSVPNSCTLCQPVLIVITSDKYKFNVPVKVLTY